MLWKIFVVSKWKFLIINKCNFSWFVDSSTVKIVDRLCVVDAKSPPYYVRNDEEGTTCKVPRKELVVYNASKGLKG